VAASREFLARWPELRGKRLAISLGRIHPKKGTDILIEAYAATLGKDEAWQLAIVGPDQLGWRKELEPMAARLGIAGRITWTGSLNGTLKWGAFSSSEVFVLPSHQENFGIVVAEALACGLPAIVSDKVNIWREVVSCGAGFVGEDTIEGTESSLRGWAALSAQEIAELRIRARKCFHDEFDYHRTSKRAMESVESLARATPRYKPIEKNS
jgi:glycosyltransferase involved in cell wall biosynthesis